MGWPSLVHILGMQSQPFVCAMSLPCLESCLLQMSTAFGSYNLSVPSLSPSLSVWYRCLIQGWALLNLLFSAHWPVMSLCINCHLLQKEASLIAWKAAQIYRYEDKYLEGSLILYLENNSSRFSPGTCDTINHRFLAQLTVPHMSYVLWSRFSIQSECAWLL